MASKKDFSISSMHPSYIQSCSIIFTVTTLCKLHTLFPSVCHMVDRESHCTLLQHGIIEVHLCLLHCLVLTVDICPYIRTLCDNGHSRLPSDIHDTLESRTMDKKLVQESSPLTLVLKCNTLHMEHCVQQQREVGHYLQSENLQSHTQPHTGMLVQSVSQQCR